jgi:hypothetical protein
MYPQIKKKVAAATATTVVPPLVCLTAKPAPSRFFSIFLEI